MTAPRNGREILRGKLKTVHSLQPSKLKSLKTLSVADGVFNDVTLRHSKQIVKVANVAFLRTCKETSPISDKRSLCTLLCANAETFCEGVYLHRGGIHEELDRKYCMR